MPTLPRRLLRQLTKQLPHRMTLRRLQALLTVFAAVLPLLVAQPARSLEAMLQGESAETMAKLVKAQGGEITHFLPVIRAVGARLSRDQLDSILESGTVDRYIDDLAFEDQPERDPRGVDSPRDCEVAGAVAINPTRKGFAWTLFNKRESAATLESLSLSWPPSLGAVREVRLDNRPVPHNSDTDDGTAMFVPRSTLAVGPHEQASLYVDFEQKPASGWPPQSKFGLKATFSGGCEVKLIPGYPDNETDYYYSEVTGANDLHQQGVRGSNVTVAVLDSGLWEHPSLALDTHGNQRIPVRYDAITATEPDSTFDESGHGTHLISALAHSGKTFREGAHTGGYRGVAPDAQVIPVKAFNESGQGSMLDIVRGIQWVIDNRARYNIRVLNLSFAARPRWPYFLDPINQAVMRAWADGIVVIAAAGNEGPGKMTIGSPGNTPYIITVGAVTDSWTPWDRSDDYIPDFSSRGPTPEAHIKPDLVAPGGHITGLIRPDSSLTQKHPEYVLGSDAFVLTGSSQAAAIVSGLTALLLQLEPDLTPDDVKCKLLTGADPAINSDGLLAYSPFVQGQGSINIVRAILVGQRGCGNHGLDIRRDIGMQEHFEGPAIVDDAGAITLPNLEKMLSPVQAAKGPSDTRVWGIKTHVERLPEDDDADTLFEWKLLYQQEKALVESMGSKR